MRLSVCARARVLPRFLLPLGNQTDAIEETVGGKPCVATRANRTFSPIVRRSIHNRKFIVTW